METLCCIIIVTGMYVEEIENDLCEGTTAMMMMMFDELL